jgi:Tol biopolymer transport system component
VGLTLVGNGISATLLGIPEQAGSFSFELTVSDTTSSASRRFDIPVSGPQRYAVWAGDSEVDNDFALYVADIAGAAPLRISPANPGSAAIELTEQYLKLSPANDKVLFLGDFTTDEVRELYFVDLAGPAPEVARPVNNTLVSGGDVVEFVWSPDGEQVLYLADQDVDGMNELYLVEVGSGVPGPSLKVNNVLQPAGDVEANSFMFSPDGTKILYLADQTVEDQRELWIADVSGTTPGPAVRVNFQLPNMVADIDTNLRFSPNSGKVFYLADQLGIGSTELWVADVGPPPVPPPARVNGLLSAGRNVSTLAGAVQVSPDGAYVAYLADQHTNDAFELYLVDYRGFPPTAPIKLNLSLPIDRDVVSFLFSPDGSRLVYVADQDTYGVFELYYVDLAGPAPAAPVKINELFQANGDVRWQDGLQFSPDGASFAYFADANLDDWRELFVVDFGGAIPGLPISVLSPGSGLTPQRFDFSPDGTRIALANEQLWVSELSPSGVPSTADAVTPFFAGGQRVVGFHWLRDSQRLFVYGDLRNDEVFEVYLSGVVPGTPIPMHPLPPSGGDARTVLVPPF